MNDADRLILLDTLLGIEKLLMEYESKAEKQVLILELVLADLERAVEVLQETPKSHHIGGILLGPDEELSGMPIEIGIGKPKNDREDK